MFSQPRYLPGMQWVEKDILLTFYGVIAAVSSMFLSFLGQLQHIIDLS